MLLTAVVFVQNLSGAFYSLLSRQLAVRMPHAQVQVAAVLFVITFLIITPPAMIYGGVEIAPLEQWWPYLLLGGLTTSLSVPLLLLVFRHMDAAMGTLLTTIYVVLGILMSMYMLGERLGPQELGGGAIALLAVTYALSVHVSKRERRNWTLGIMFTLTGGLCFAIGSVVQKFLLDQMDVPSYIVWGMGAQSVVGVLLGLAWNWRGFGDVLKLKHVKILLTAGLFRSGMAVLFVSSIVMFKNLCLAMILAGMRPLFVSFLGAWFFHERQFLARKVVASIIAAIGIAIMFV